MPKQSSWMVLFGMLILGTGAATAGQGGTASVTGTVSYRQRSALPPNAEVTVRLVDVSRADAPAVELAVQTFVTGGKQVPFPFSLSYDPAAIDQRFNYAVQAEIHVDGQLSFITTQSYPVITRGNPTTVDVIVEPVSGGTPARLPSTGAPSGGLLLTLALAIAALMVGASLRRGLPCLSDAGKQRYRSARRR